MHRPNVVREPVRPGRRVHSVDGVHPTFVHEQLMVRRGDRSGFPIVVAIHSSALGPAIGGCRLRHYPDWRDGVADALRLSEGMTYKNAVAGLANGGAKSVIVAPDGGPLDPEVRRAVLLDLGDIIEALDGVYATGPDIGTGPDDMVTVAERTRHVFCLPAAHGGSGDSSPPTARGVYAAIRAVCGHRFGSADPAGRRIGVIGLGSVGSLVARMLADAGARLVVTDVDPAKRELAGELGADWIAPEEAIRIEADILVPAAVGGLLTVAAVAELRCAAIAGPANNQLAADGVADLLHRRGILWVPDYVVSAGGVIHATAVETRDVPVAAALAEVDRIGATVMNLLDAADRMGETPHRAARRIAEGRLAEAGLAVAGR
jgi:leucine dehydrogenase